MVDEHPPGGGRPLRAVAFGGGHGLAAALSAWRHLTTDVTAVVTVADDGGSSGRIRRELPVLPPGDLRMALAALTGPGSASRAWPRCCSTGSAAPGAWPGTRWATCC